MAVSPPRKATALKKAMTKVKGWAGSLSRACPTLLNEAAGHERRS